MDNINYDKMDNDREVIMGNVYSTSADSVRVVGSKTADKAGLRKTCFLDDRLTRFRTLNHGMYPKDDHSIAEQDGERGHLHYSLDVATKIFSSWCQTWPVALSL